MKSKCVLVLCLSAFFSLPACSSRFSTVGTQAQHGSVKLAKNLFLLDDYSEWYGAGRVKSTEEFDILKKAFAVSAAKGNIGTWLGIPSMQSTEDNHMMQELIAELKPDYIIETGTYKGGTTLFYATVLEKVSKNGRVITIDIDPQVEEASKFDVFRERVTVLKGDVVSEEVISRIGDIVKPGDTVLVTLDTSHKREHVLKELQVYSKFVSAGGYIAVQCTACNVGHNPGNGPLTAVRAFLRRNKDFIIDNKRERFLFSSFLSGFLKRVK